ncbi:10569_t:CDS:1, partial [Funneliformis geosporum]
MNIGYDVDNEVECETIGQCGACGNANNCPIFQDESETFLQCYVLALYA